MGRIHFGRSFPHGGSYSGAASSGNRQFPGHADMTFRWRVTTLSFSKQTKLVGPGAIPAQPHFAHFSLALKMSAADSAPVNFVMVDPAKGKDIRWIPIVQIHPAPENDKLYGPINPADPKIQQMASEMRRERKCSTLLTLSRDFFVMDGHRRLTAAKLAGLTKLECIIDSMPHSDPKFVQELVRFKINESNRMMSFSGKRLFRRVRLMPTRG
jgi:hypothetical protein